MAAVAQGVSSSGLLSCRGSSSIFERHGSSAHQKALSPKCRRGHRIQCSVSKPAQKKLVASAERQSLPIVPMVAGLAAALATSPVQAADLVAPIAEGGPSIGVAVAGLAAAAAAVVGAVKLTDPEAR